MTFLTNIWNTLTKPALETPAMLDLNRVEQPAAQHMTFFLNCKPFSPPMLDDDHIVSAMLDYCDERRIGVSVYGGSEAGHYWVQTMGGSVRHKRDGRSPSVALTTTSLGTIDAFVDAFREHLQPQCVNGLGTLLPINNRKDA